jgi:nucleotide-binding universal stress UspA family protein
MNDMEIVIGLEDDPPSTAALRWAVEQAMRTGARLRVVHVWTPPMAEMFSPRASVRQAHQQDVRARVTHTVNRVLEDMSVRTNWVLELVEGSPGPMLLHCAQSAELLVLGTPEDGHPGAGTSSVGHYVLSHAVCPVVAVPGAVPVRVAAPRAHSAVRTPTDLRPASQ